MTKHEQKLKAYLIQAILFGFLAKHWKYELLIPWLAMAGNNYFTAYYVI